MRLEGPDKDMCTSANSSTDGETSASSSVSLLFHLCRVKRERVDILSGGAFFASKVLGANTLKQYIKIRAMFSGVK